MWRSRRPIHTVERISAWVAVQQPLVSLAPPGQPCNCCRHLSPGQRHHRQRATRWAHAQSWADCTNARHRAPQVASSAASARRTQPAIPSRTPSAHSTRGTRASSRQKVLGPAARSAAATAGSMRHGSSAAHAHTAELCRQGSHSRRTKGTPSDRCRPAAAGSATPSTKARRAARGRPVARPWTYSIPESQSRWRSAHRRCRTPGKPRRRPCPTDPQSGSRPPPRRRPQHPP
mmetsp:Transcript_100422/g.322113  ORF Transcript_100422/g.322113 Transcript_100422/m.322113 type:complete len:232 (+) Transcript_100422:235-930(+)